MANTDTPMGFKPIGHLLGLNWTDCVEVFYLPTSDSDRIGLYDLVEPAGSADTTGKYPTVARATAAQTDLLGSVVGFSNSPDICVDTTNLERRYRVASTEMYVTVVTDPYVLYLAQEDSDTSTLAATDVSSNCDIVVSDCDTTTGLSAMELDSDSAATANGQIRIMRLYNDPNNAIGDNAKWVCMINEHSYKYTTAGT